MKQLPDEKTMLELLELVKDAALKAKEMNDLAREIQEKYTRRMREIREARKQQIGVTE